MSINKIMFNYRYHNFKIKINSIIILDNIHNHPIINNNNNNNNLFQSSKITSTILSKTNINNNLNSFRVHNSTNN